MLRNEWGPRRVGTGTMTKRERDARARKGEI